MKFKDIESPLVNKPRRWILGLNNLPPEPISQQSMKPSVKDKVIFPPRTIRTLETLYCDIDRLCYYGFSFKLIKVIIDGLGVYRMDAAGVRGSEEWKQSMESQAGEAFEQDKESLKKLEELNKAEQKVLEMSGFMR